MINTAHPEDIDRFMMDRLFRFDPISLGLALGATAETAAAAGMAAYSIGATVIGTGISVMGQISAGNAQNAIAQRNAQIQLRDADIAKKNAEFNAQLQEKSDARKRSSDRSKSGASGTIVNDGTNLLAQAEQEFVDDLNAELIRRGGRTTAAGLREQAALTSASGQAGKAASLSGAGSSLLTGLGNTGIRTAQFKQQGLFK
jgi:Skp family chaperone for outer membrane proteins